ncbi:MAG: CBS domain-containing protein [Clostridia bacterium]|nr:CBS domain-containing protein [Clostridia bacterium]
MKANIRDTFIAEYKQLERCVDELSDFERFFAFERALPESESTKMEMCRMMRNFIMRSNDPAFVLPTEEMVDFLREKQKEVIKNEVTAEKLMTRVASVSSDLTPQDVAEKVLERGFVPVVNGDGSFAGIITEKSIIKAVAEGRLNEKMSSFKIFMEHPESLSPRDRTKGLHGEFVVTDNGQRTGKYKGMLCL